MLLYIKNEKSGGMLFLSEKILKIENMEQMSNLFGNLDENIKIIEKNYNVSTVLRGNEIKIMGNDDNVTNAANAISGILFPIVI